MKRNQKGFTLIELLAVIVVLAIIALIATPMVLKYIEDARRGAAESDCYAAIKAAELEYARAILDNETETLATYNSTGIDVSALSIKHADNMEGTLLFTGSEEKTATLAEGFTSRGFACSYADGTVTCNDAATE